MLLLFSCNKNEKVKINKYFDLENYFKQEAQRLQRGGFKLEKKLVEGPYSETVLIDSADWKKMLSPFMSCDINKPAWINSYASDSIVSGDSSRVIYTAKEKGLQIRRVEIFFIDKTPFEIKIERTRENFYYTSKEIYNYHPDAFVINSKQKVRLMSEERYQITGRFVR